MDGVGTAGRVMGAREFRRGREDPLRVWLEKRRPAHVAIVYLAFVSAVAVIGLSVASALVWVLCGLPFPGAVDDVVAIEDPPQEGSVGAHAVLLPMDYSQIPMNRPEADLLAAYLNPEHLMLEWGEGGTSRALQSRVSKAYVISSRAMTCDNRASGDNIESRCVAIRGITDDEDLVEKPSVPAKRHATYDDAREYVNVVEQLGVEKFDIVVIDGRARAACALRVLPFLKPSSLVFMHDFFGRMDLYGGVMQWYDEVARVMAYEHTGGPEQPKGLIVLKRKDIVSDDLVPLPDSELREMYTHANLEKEMYASRVGAFKIVTRTDENGFALKQWKDEKKMNMSLYRLFCDAFVLMCIIGSMRCLRVMYETYFDSIFQQHGRSRLPSKSQVLSA